jgi:hypothetical protein
MVKVKLRSSDTRTSIHFLSHKEAVEALSKLQAAVEKLKSLVINVPFDVVNYIDTKFLEHQQEFDSFEGLEWGTGVLTKNGISILDSDFVGLGGNLDRTTNLILGSGSALIFKDDRNVKQGIKYANDYSDSFVDNSLVSKKYVDESLQATVNADNGIVDNGGTMSIGGSLIRPTNLDLELGSTFIFTDLRTNKVGIQYNGDYSTSFVDNSLVSKKYVDEKTYLFTAGAGLTGSGLSGIIGNNINTSFDINTINGISIINDSVGLGGDLMQNTNINTGIYTLNIDGNVLISNNAINYDGDLSSTFGTYSLIDINYLDFRLTDINYLFNAGYGLTGTGLSGNIIDGIDARFDVNVINGISIINDSVGLGGDLMQNTTINTLGYTLNIDGNLLVSTNAVNYDGDLSSTFGTYSLIDKNYLDVRLTNINYLFNAGYGLTGTGLSGNIIDGIDARFDVNTINGISIINDSVGLGGTLSQNTTIDVSTYQLNIDGQLIVSTNPINYADNYSGQYVDRSLIDLGYLNQRLTEISVEGIGVEAGQGLTASMPGVNLRLSSLGDVQRVVPSGQTIDIATEFQNLIYGNLELEGDIDNSGKLTIINGTISGSGSVIGTGDVEFIDLVEDYEKDDPKWNANKILSVEVDDTNKGSTSSQFLSYNTSTQKIEYQTLNYIHYQPVASDTWTITHNLNRFPSITVVDSGENVVEGCATYISANEVQLEFIGSFGGKAYLT